jgi:nucleoside-diphosphate-sugar epimerase
MSNLARHWLERYPDAECVVVDTAPPDEAVDRFFGPLRDRARFVEADVRDTSDWSVDREGITHVVHGATITSPQQPEAAAARWFVDVNVTGTVSVLEWAKGLPELRRLIYVSSGSVYGDAAAPRRGEAVREDDRTEPRDIYAISKFAAERIVERCAASLGIDAAVVRLSTVYGPMDRSGQARTAGSIPYKLARMAVAGERIAVDSLDDGADWVHAEDVASAIVALLRLPSLEHTVYNVAYGELVPVEALLRVAGTVIPDFCYTVAEPEVATLRTRPQFQGAAWAPYDTGRLRSDVGWQPESIDSRFASYLRWLQAHREAA